MSQIIFQYTVRSEPSAIQERAEALLLEQTVELPRKALADSWVNEHIVGKVLEVTRIGEDFFSLIISHPLRTTALDPAQFLNVAFGNSSLQPDVTLDNIEAPIELFAKFKGPKFGIESIRAKVGVQHRALTCTALKPMGLPADRLARLAYDFAIAGLDMIKDDHGLADHEFCSFQSRVEECQTAVEKANAETGLSTIYIPNLIGSPETVYKQLEFARQRGVGGIMISPMLVGPALLHELADGKAGLPIFAHPAFGGAMRIAPQVLLGQIFKWFGADAVIFPHHGGRFSYSRETCLKLAEFSRSTSHGLHPAFPVPAGGIKTSRVREVLEFYGKETILLVGGSLLESGSELVAKAKEFVAEVAEVSKSL